MTDDHADPGSRFSAEEDVSKSAEAPTSGSRLDRICAQFIRGRQSGRATLGTRESAALRRYDPKSPSRSMSAIVPVLMRAEVYPVDDDEWRRWGEVLRMIALLSGTGGRRVHSTAASAAAGRMLFNARFSENRLARLLTARGSTLGDQLPRLARYLAASGSVPINLHPIVDMVMKDGRDEAGAEAARIRLAREYYQAATKPAIETKAS